MFEITLDNSDNDRKTKVTLPIVPRIGDWINLEFENDFTEELFLTVKHVIISATEIIAVVYAD